MEIVINKNPARLVLLGALGGCLVLSGCASPSEPDAVGDGAPASAAGFPLEIENCGRTLAFDGPPQRIVTLEQTLTELALSLGVEDRMVGTSYLTDPVLPELVDPYDTVPVLAELYPAQEVVIEAAPDFIYAYGATSVSAENAGTPESWAELGVPVYISPVSCPDAADSVPDITFDGWFEEIRTIAAITGQPEAGEALIAAQQQRIDAAIAEPVPAGLDIVWWYAGTDTPFFGTGTSDAEHVADLLGAENVFADGGPGRWATTSWEVIAERDPDVIILADLTRGNDGDSAQSKIDYLMSNPVTAQLSAVQAERFIVVPGSARGYSVRTVESLELIADGLRELG